MQQGSCTAFLAHVQLLARTAELHRSDVGVWVTNWGGEVELEPYMVCLDSHTGPTPTHDAGKWVAATVHTCSMTRCSYSMFHCGRCPARDAVLCKWCVSLQDSLS